jgi:DNA-binding helix-hairpin-helix protein with protein kinase domain
MPVVTLKQPPSGLPSQLQLKDTSRSGGEGMVFFSLDDQYAVKVYHQPRPDKEELLKRVMPLFSSLPPSQQGFLLPPLALVDQLDGQPRVGFVMRKVPIGYHELVEFMHDPSFAARQFQSGRTWADYLKTARSIATAVVVLHGKGCAHCDISYRNFMVHLAQGAAVMLEIDGAVVPGFLPPQVKGTMGFMAPEILAQNVSPSERSDRYSLAVLIVYTLLFRNVMTPLVEYANDPESSDHLGWGKEALFSEEPGNHLHRPKNLGRPLFRRGAMSYRLLTPALQALTERTFLRGYLADPEDRPSAREWEEALAYALDELVVCQRCGQPFPYPFWLHPPARRMCPFCGERVAEPMPVVLELYEERLNQQYVALGRRLVLGHGFKVFADQVTNGRKPPVTRKGDPIVGHVHWDGQRFQLINESTGVWTAQSTTSRTVAGQGQSLLLMPGTKVHFGAGHRLALVQQV